jgi:hypothetical protein
MTNVINLFSETIKTEPAHKIRFFIKNTNIEILTELKMTQFNNYDNMFGMDITHTEEEWAEMACEDVFQDHLEGYEPELQAYIDALVDSDTLEIRAERIYTDMRNRPGYWD